MQKKLQERQPCRVNDFASVAHTHTHKALSQEVGMRPLACSRSALLRLFEMAFFGGVHGHSPRPHAGTQPCFSNLWCVYDSPLSRDVCGSFVSLPLFSLASSLSVIHRHPNHQRGICFIITDHMFSEAGGRRVSRGELNK